MATKFQKDSPDAVFSALPLTSVHSVASHKNKLAWTFSYFC